MNRQAFPLNNGERHFDVKLLAPQTDFELCLIASAPKTIPLILLDFFQTKSDSDLEVKRKNKFQRIADQPKPSTSFNRLEHMIEMKAVENRQLWTPAGIRLGRRGSDVQIARPDQIRQSLSRAGMLESPFQLSVTPR